MIPINIHLWENVLQDTITWLTLMLIVVDHR
jgi:hypothetical protein